MVDEPARRQGAMFGVGERKKIVLDEPDEVRGHCDEGRRRGNIGTGRCQGLARVAVDHEEQRKRNRQHGHEIFCPQRHSDRETEQQPMPDPPAAQGTVKGKTRQGPERQLHDVVIEFRRRVIEIMQSVDDQHRDQGAHRTDQRPCREPHQP